MDYKSKYLKYKKKYIELKNINGGLIQEKMAMDEYLKMKKKILIIERNTKQLKKKLLNVEKISKEILKNIKKEN